MGYSIKQVYSNSKSSAICLGLEIIDMYFASALVYSRGNRASTRKFSAKLPEPEIGHTCKLHAGMSCAELSYTKFLLGTVRYSVYRTAALRITYLQRVLREHNAFFSSRFYVDLILSTRSDRDWADCERGFHKFISYLQRFLKCQKEKKVAVSVSGIMIIWNYRKCFEIVTND